MLVVFPALADISGFALPRELRFAMVVAFLVAIMIIVAAGLLERLGPFWRPRRVSPKKEAAMVVVFGALIGALIAPWVWSRVKPDEAAVPGHMEEAIAPLADKREEAALAELIASASEVTDAEEMLAWLSRAEGTITLFYGEQDAARMAKLLPASDDEARQKYGGADVLQDPAFVKMVMQNAIGYLKAKQASGGDAESGSW